MKSRLTFILITLASVSTLPLHAGNVSSLFTELNLNGVVNCDTTLLLPRVSKSKPITVKWGKSQPAHVGISLFSPQMKDMINHEICNFVERLFLELSLFPSTDEAALHLHRHKITLTRNAEIFGKGSFNDIRKSIEEITQPSLFNVSNDKGIFTVTLEYGIFNNIRISFPASRELISGTDKKESDMNVSSILQSPKTAQKTNREIKASELLKYKNGISRLPGKEFMINRLRNDSYYISNSLKPVFSAKAPHESIINLMQGIVDTGIRLEVKHRMYGNFTPDFIIRLNDLFNAFSDGFDIYTGYQELDDGRIQCITIFHNHLYNYLHMLIVSAGKEQYFNPNAVLDADFFSNIPQHYIKNLF